MANSHYYDEKSGRVIKRPPIDPEAKAGRSAGLKQRTKDQASSYPRPGLPISREGRSKIWVEHYQRGYYQSRSTGQPMLGDEPITKIFVQCDRQLIEQLDLAGISRADAFACGAKALLEQLKAITELDQRVYKNSAENQKGK